MNKQDNANKTDKNKSKAENKNSEFTYEEFKVYNEYMWKEIAALVERMLQEESNKKSAHS